MKKTLVWRSVGFPVVTLLIFGMPVKALAWEDVRQEWRQEMGEVRDERREAGWWTRPVDRVKHSSQTHID